MTIAYTTSSQFNKETFQHENVELPINVGDGASYGIGGDAYPLTVRKISPSGKTIWCSRDDFEATPGANSYEEARKVGTFIPMDEDKPENWMKFTKRQDGRFRQAGCKYASLGLGRCYRQDPHF